MQVVRNKAHLCRLESAVVGRRVAEERWGLSDVCVVGARGSWGGDLAVRDVLSRICMCSRRVR